MKNAAVTRYRRERHSMHVMARRVANSHTDGQQAGEIRPAFKQSGTFLLASHARDFDAVRQPRLNQSSSPSSSSLSPLSSSITPSLFHSKLKHIFSKNLFHHRHPYPSTGLTSRISGCFCFLLLNGFLFSSHFIYFFSLRFRAVD